MSFSIILNIILVVVVILLGKSNFHNSRLVDKLVAEIGTLGREISKTKKFPNDWRTR